MNLRLTFCAIRCVHLHLPVGLSEVFVVRMEGVAIHCVGSSTSSPLAAGSRLSDCVTIHDEWY